MHTYATPDMIRVCNSAPGAGDGNGRVQKLLLKRVGHGVPAAAFTATTKAAAAAETYVRVRKTFVIHISEYIYVYVTLQQATYV